MVPLRALLLGAVVTYASGASFIMSTSCPGPTTVTVGAVDTISLVASGNYALNM